MLPDNMAGGLILSLVNMGVVFLVLAFLALMIKMTYLVVGSRGSNGRPGGDGRAGTTSGTDREEERGDTLEEEVLEPAQSRLEIEGSPVLAPSIKAAIVAALSSYLEGTTVRVFVRRIPDSGVWGKSARAPFLSHNSLSRKR